MFFCSCMLQNNPGTYRFPKVFVPTNMVQYKCNVNTQDLTQYIFRFIQDIERDFHSVMFYFT